MCAFSDELFIVDVFSNIQYQQKLATEQLLLGQAVYGPSITAQIIPAGPLSSNKAGQNAVLHCKDKMPKIETNIPRKGISGSQSQFTHSCICERIIYSHDGSAFSAGGNMWDDPGSI